LAWGICRASVDVTEQRICIEKGGFIVSIFEQQLQHEQKIKGLAEETWEADISLLHERIDKLGKTIERLERVVDILVKKNGGLTTEEEEIVEA